MPKPYLKNHKKLSMFSYQNDKKVFLEPHTRLNVAGGGGRILKSLPLLLSLFPIVGVYAADPVGTTSCSTGFCAAELNFKNPKSVYTTPDHKNVQLNINNPAPLNSGANMVLQAYGKDESDLINVKGDMNVNIPVDQKSLLGIDFKNVNYVGNMNFSQSNTQTLDNNSNLTFNFDHSTLNGNINLTHYRLYDSTLNSVLFNHSTLNGNLNIKADSSVNVAFKNSTLNGNFSWIYDNNTNPIGVTPHFTFDGATFNHSTINIGLDPTKNFDAITNSLAQVGYYGVFSNTTFNNSTLNNTFKSAYLEFNNVAFNGGKIITLNTGKGINPQANTHSSVDIKGSDIRADIEFIGNGSMTVTKITGYTSEKNDPNPQYNTSYQLIYADQKPTTCKNGLTNCYTPHDPTKPETPQYDTDGDVIRGNVQTYQPKPITQDTTTKLGVDFTLESIAATDLQNGSNVYKTSSFEGNLSLVGGNNNFTIKDASKVKNGTLSIQGGNNNFQILGNSSFDGYHIEISRLLKRKSEIGKDDLANWQDCGDDSSLCYQDPVNTFSVTNSSFKNTSFEIIGGTSNTFNFTTSSFIDGDIRLLGGLKNTLTFQDTPKIGGTILISGGDTNQLSFKNTTLSDTTKYFIAPKGAGVSKSTSGNPFDPTSMTTLKYNIIQGQMTESFLKTLNDVTPDLFKGDIILGSSSTSNTANTLAFENGAVLGDLMIQNGNADNIKKVDSTISMTSNLFLGDIKSNGMGMTTRVNLKDSGMVGDIQTSNGITYTTLDNSELYGDISTSGGVNITQIKDGSVFAGSMSTYNGKNFIDLNMSLYTNQNGQVSHINTYGGESNITLTINAAIAQVLTNQKIYPVFHIGNYNGGVSNIAVEGPVSGTAQVDYSGGTANIIFADAFDTSVTNSFFATSAGCTTVIDDNCLKGGQAVFDADKQVFKVNGYTYQDGLAIKLDAQKADTILKPFRDVYPTNYVSIFLDKSGVAPNGTKDNIYRMRIDGVVVGAEYNLPSSSNRQYEVTFGPNSAFIGEMKAKTDNTNFILSQGSKLVLDGGSNSVISKLSSQVNFTADTNTMFDATLAQKTNTIIDLATGGQEVTRAFKKNTFSNIYISEMDNFNNAVFRVGIDPSKTDSVMNINSIPNNTDRIIIKDVATGQNLRDYLQVYQDYNHLVTGDLTDKNILVAVIENSPKLNTSMVFDTSASNVQQGYDQVSTVLSVKPVKVNEKSAGGTGDGSININSGKDSNAMGYFIQSAATRVDPRNLANTNSAITSNYSIFLANINNLNKRLGELRDNSYAQGVWSRVFSGLNTSTREDESKIYSNNIQFGYDYGWNTSAGEQFLGAAITYGYDSIKGKAYNGSANLLEFAGYYSWVGDQGLFTDTILKYTYIRNKISIKDNIDYNVPLNSNGGSIGQELGYRFYADKDKKFYIEPSAEVILGVMNGGVINQVSQSGIMENNDFIATLKADLNYIFNFRGKVGANFGYRLKTEKNQTDFRIGAFYVADVVNGGVINYKTNYSAAQTLIQPNQQLMLNIGVNSVVSENWRVYADLDSGLLGQYFNQTYLVSVGLRYEFGHALNPLAAKLAEEKRLKNIKLYTQRLDEGIANVKLKQDRIRQSEIFEKQKADILATSAAKQKANLLIRQKERDLDAAKFKTLTLAIGKVINEALPDSELEKFQVQEQKVLADAKERVMKNIESDAELNRKDNENSKIKSTKELQKNQADQLKELETKQAENKKQMLETQSKSKEAYVQKQAKDKQAFIATQAQDLKKAKADEKTKLEAKQAQDLKDFEAKQAKDMKLFIDRMDQDVKKLQDKQTKALSELKAKQEKAAVELKAKQDKQDKDVEAFILRQKKGSSSYLDKISKELEDRQTKAKKDLQEAQKKSLGIKIKKAVDDGMSEDEFEKLQAQESSDFQNAKAAITADLKAKSIKATKELKDSQAQALQELEQKQATTLKEFEEKIAKEKKETRDNHDKIRAKLSATQAQDLKNAKPADKAKLQAKQNKDSQELIAKLTKETKALDAKESKALADLKEKLAKEKKEMNQKAIKESKNLELKLAKESKENEEYWKKAAIELQAKQTKDKKALQESRKNIQSKADRNVKKPQEKQEKKAPASNQKQTKPVAKKKK